jgi:hypothetical protein
MLSTCSGDEAITIIEKFQRGELAIENINVEDLE